MPIRVALHHKTDYRYDRLVALSPQIVRLTDSQIATDSTQLNGGNIRQIQIFPDIQKLAQAIYDFGEAIPVDAIDRAI